jgi:PBP1b-binding outer membrane lipoprotein LpoB
MKMKSFRLLITVIAVGLFLNSCSNNTTESKSGTTRNDSAKETFSLNSLVKESKQIPDSVIALLNAQHHHFKVFEGGLCRVHSQSLQ